MALSKWRRAPDGGAGAWPHWLFSILILGGLVLLFTVAAVEPVACGPGPYSQAVAKGEARWCLEFWLERYQTILAAALSLAGAFAAFLMLVKQNNHMAKQFGEARAQRAIGLQGKTMDRWSELAQLDAPLFTISKFSVRARIITRYYKPQQRIPKRRRNPFGTDFVTARATLKEVIDYCEGAITACKKIRNEYAGGPMVQSQVNALLLFLNDIRQQLEHTDVITDEENTASSEFDFEESFDIIESEVSNLFTSRSDELLTNVRSLASAIQREKDNTEARLEHLERLMSDNLHD